MDDLALNANARELEQELEWFVRILNARLTSHFQTDGPPARPQDIAPPPPGDTVYGRFVAEHRLSAKERLVLILALIPHLRPQLLDVLWTRNKETERGFTEFGGVQTAAHCGFIPTGETAMFILAGEDMAARLQVQRLFEPDHLFARTGLLHLGSVSPADPLMSGALLVAREQLCQLTSGLVRRPRFSSEFPARRVETELSWEQLVLPTSIVDQLGEIRDWIQHGPRLLGEWGMAAKLRPGFTALFHGPPGTVKTLSACLIGKQCGCEVYKIDLSLIVSKYIGETEKNLSSIFDLAEHKRWILFFDEADALFGRRTKVSDSHDRYANQEVSFLLQRIEEFNGVVILASNMKANIDDAFLRRFHTVVFFPMPREAERRRIWESAFSAKAQMEPRIEFSRLAERYELSGGTIMNVVRYSSLKALSRSEPHIVLLEDLEEGIRRELQKEGRTR